MTVQILRGDCRELLRTLPDESVHCVVTSPPYWGLRDYGVNGQMGLEASLGQHVDEMCAVFREVRRVLRKDGTLWLNYGDGYFAQQGNGFPGTGQTKLDDASRNAIRQLKRPSGLKPKDLMGMPWRVSFALQADGWYLRSDIIWSKPNPMPESVTDRPTKAHEYLFLLSKSQKYHYDADAIREPGVTTVEEAQSKWATRRNGEGKGQKEGVYHSYRDVKPFQNDPNPLGRNSRTVWEIPTAPFSEAHFATFPPDLIRPCIEAGCPKQCCAKCGAPWVRETELTDEYKALLASGKAWRDATGKPDGFTNRHPKGHPSQVPTKHKTLGFSPSCSCPQVDNTGDYCTRPGTVLDPFGGAGTTGLVADRLGRNAILIELNPEYAEMAERRIKGDCPMFAEVG